MKDIEYRIIFLESVVTQLIKQFYGADYDKLYQDSLKQIEKEGNNV